VVSVAVMMVPFLMMVSKRMGWSSVEALVG